MEQTTLFTRGIGEATDVVSKEMFNALSDANLNTLIGGGHIKDKSRMSLRPEGTAGTIRAIIENGMVSQGSAPVKLMYAGPMFRAERPAAGRYRQFMQIGVECVGTSAPTSDAEAIIMLMDFYKSIGFGSKFHDVELLINSMGCKKCRAKYRDVLVSFLDDKRSNLCATCQERIGKNPLRVLDCKEKACQQILQDAPVISDYLCEECKEHHAKVKQYLDGAGVKYSEDTKLVRGLDYYNRTVFEVKSGSVGAQDAIAGGGRYDGLVEQLGGPQAPGFGFAMGYERTVLAMQNEGFVPQDMSGNDVFVACVDESCTDKCFEIAQTLRANAISCEIDHQNRSLKSQFKLANKLKAKITIVLGPDEVAQNCANVRNMINHEENMVKLEQLNQTITEMLKEQ